MSQHIATVFWQRNGAAFTDNQVLHVPAPYDDPRFNREVDKRTGFVTRNILAAPMSDIARKPTGVLQASSDADAQRA